MWSVIFISAISISCFFLSTGGAQIVAAMLVDTENGNDNVNRKVSLAKAASMDLPTFRQEGSEYRELNDGYLSCPVTKAKEDGDRCFVSKRYCFTSSPTGSGNRSVLAKSTCQKGFTLLRAEGVCMKQKVYGVARSTCPSPKYHKSKDGCRETSEPKKVCTLSTPSPTDCIDREYHTGSNLFCFTGYERDTTDPSLCRFKGGAVCDHDQTFKPEIGLCVSNFAYIKASKVCAKGSPFLNLCLETLYMPVEYMCPEPHESSDEDDEEDEEDEEDVYPDPLRALGSEDEINNNLRRALEETSDDDDEEMDDGVLDMEKLMKMVEDMKKEGNFGIDDDESFDDDDSFDSIDDDESFGTGNHDSFGTGNHDSFGTGNHDSFGTGNHDSFGIGKHDSFGTGKDKGFGKDNRLDSFEEDPKGAVAPGAYIKRVMEAPLRSGSIKGPVFACLEGVLIHGSCEATRYALPVQMCPMGFRPVETGGCESISTVSVIPSP